MNKREEKPESNTGYTQISIRVKSELLLKIEELAKNDNRNRNNMIHQLLEKATKGKR